MIGRRGVLGSIGFCVMAATAGCSDHLGDSESHGIDLYIHNNIDGKQVSVTVQLSSDEVMLLEQFVTLQAGPRAIARSRNAVQTVEDPSDITVAVELNDGSYATSSTVTVGCQPESRNTEVIVSIESITTVLVDTNGCGR